MIPAFMYLTAQRKKNILNKHTNEYVIPERLSATQKKDKHSLSFLSLSALTFPLLIPQILTEHQLNGKHNARHCGYRREDG